jgi:TatD DNase family protein
MFFDTHCHLSTFKDIPAVMAKARAHAVKYILAVSMYYQDNWTVLDLAKAYPEVIPALGIHPIEAANLSGGETKLEPIKKLIVENNIRVIGEIGLDHYFIKEKPLWKNQEAIFHYFLELAAQNRLAVNLHGKDAEGKLFSILSEYDLDLVVVHWFAGGPELIKEGIDRGYYFSVTPAVSYSDKMQKVVELVPIEHLLSESDGPVKYKGQVPVIGEPALMEDVIREIARIKQQNSHEIEQVLYETAKRLFLK